MFRASLSVMILGVGLFTPLAPLHAAPRENQTKVSVAFECKGPIAKAVAEKAFSQVQATYKGIATQTAKFDQDSHLSALQATESSSGNVWFRKPGKMKWRYEQPERQDFILKDHTVWLYQPEIQQVLIDELEQVLLTDLPVSFLMGVGDLQKGFTLVSGCQTSYGTALTLAPKTKESGDDEKLKGFVLLVDGEARPIGARVLDVAGNVTAILLTDIKTDIPFEDSVFDVTFPPNTDVNDRRRKGE